MPVFEYKALNYKGKKVSGLITADGPSAARLRLTRDRIFPTSVREVMEPGRRHSLAARIPGFSRWRRVSPSELSASLRQLSTLVSSGLPLVECLNGVIEQTPRGGLKRTWIQVRERVVEGVSLSQAMSTHRNVFHPIFVNMVHAGETGGALDVILKRLADFSERRVKLKKRIESALAYPVFLLMVSSIIVIFLMSFVMPKVVGIFEGMDLTLPLSTIVLIETTRFMQRFWWLVAGGVVVVLAGVAMWIRTDTGGRLWDRVRMSVPFLGSLHRKAVIARFTRTLATLLKSGIILVDALEISRLSMGNRIMEEAVAEVSKRVSEGADFASPLERSGRFPPLLVQLVSAGEKSGELDEMLVKAAEVYEEDVESAVAGLTSIIEPVIILLMGGMVAFMVMAVLLPIFDMTGGVR